MADRDREILTEAGLSMAEVANYLGVTRQAVAKQVGAPKAFLTEARLKTICTTLMALGSARARTAAQALVAIAKRQGHEIELVEPPDPVSSLRVGDEAQLQEGSPLGVKEFWVFSDEPIELDARRGGFLDFMAENIFCDATRLAAYFVPNAAVGQELRRVFGRVEVRMKYKGLQFKASVFIIETNMVVPMPHTLVLAPGSHCIEGEHTSVATGWVLVGASRAQMMELPDRDVRKIIRLVQYANIGQTGPGLADFFPKSKLDTAVSTYGATRSESFYFKKLWSKVSQ